jgi:hypothetical protein
VTAPAKTAPTTGHPLGDALLRPALALVAAVHNGDLRAAHEAIAQAHQTARRHRSERCWTFAWMCTLAALVPEDRPVSELLRWVDDDTRPGWAT